MKNRACLVPDSVGDPVAYPDGSELGALIEIQQPLLCQASPLVLAPGVHLDLGLEFDVDKIGQVLAHQGHHPVCTQLG